MRGFGLLLLLGGCVGVLYFYGQDTSVAVPESSFGGINIGGGRVNNIGLMQERQNGLMVSIGAAIVGAILMALAPKSEADADTKSHVQSEGKSGEFSSPATKTLSQRLDQLNELRASGSISAEEYEGRRAAILNEI